MEKAIHIEGGKVDKDSINASVDGIVKVLEATLGHRSNEVTITALNILRGSMDVSVSDLSFNNMNITGADTAVEVGSISDGSTDLEA